MKKRFAALFLVFLLTIIFATAVSADMGPKPKLTIIVHQPPQGTYYLDLLMQGSGERYDNLRERREGLREEMLEKLFSLEGEGWHPALAGGTGAPLFGELVGTREGDEMVHSFGYFGLPDTFRVIIVDAAGKVTTTEPFTRKTFHTVIHIYYDEGKASEAAASPDAEDIYLTAVSQGPLVAYLLQFFSTFLATLLIEGLLLLLFRFSLKANWKQLLLVNLVTQVCMTLTLGRVLIRFGLLSAALYFVPVEGCILLAEALIYAFVLKGHSKKRRVGYAVAANIASAAIGLLLMWLEYQFYLR